MKKILTITLTTIFIIILSFNAYSIKVKETGIKDFPISGTVIKVLTYNNYYLIVNQALGVKVYKKTDKNFKNIKGFLQIKVLDALVIKNRLYLLNDEEGFFIYEITKNGDKIEFLSIYAFLTDLEVEFKKMTSHKNYLILTGKYGEIYVFDSNDLKSNDPVFVSSVPNSLIISDLLIYKDEYLLIGDARKGLFIYQIRPKGELKYIKDIPFEDGVTTLYHHKLEDLLYIGNSTGIHICTFNNLKLEEQFYLSIHLKLINDILVLDDFLYYVSEQEFGVVEISNKKKYNELLFLDMHCYTFQLFFISKNEFLIPAYCSGLKKVELKYYE
ncbi:hypothetical protein KAU33_12775 [Candidatus Dependentiae bacterium]|nr:hypothetical protein [Candidatus Dependentiae bacterium]